jgi:NitT/TauT family transport system permease protein
MHNRALSSRHIHHHRHPGYSFMVHPRQRWYGLVGVPILAVVVAWAIIHPVVTPGTVSIGQLLGALVLSLFRLMVAYALALVLSLPLAMLINRSLLTEKILLPAFDILQSVPVLAFFPVVIIFFVQINFLEGAAVFIIFINMLWNMVFSIVGGLKLMPGDIKSAAQIFGIRRVHYLRWVLIPAIFPYLVTGSLLAWAEGWNMLIVAEVLHTYLPGGSESSDLLGIGSVMVHASASGQGNMFVGAILVMILAIALMNIFLWQKLLHYAERYRFE